MKYEVLHLTSSRPSGVGMYEVGLRYAVRKPRWGILPVTNVKDDLLTYRVYVKDGVTVAEERSLMTRHLGCNIPPALSRKILTALQEAGYIDETTL